MTRLVRLAFLAATLAALASEVAARNMPWAI